jgi:hypothetical protein
MLQRQLFLLALTLCWLLGCSPAAPDNPGGLGVTNDGTYVSGTGAVTYITIEGGSYAISGDDKRTYVPINLDQSYRVEGLRVRFRAILRKDLLTTLMMGQTIELLEIKRL